MKTFLKQLLKVTLVLAVISFTGCKDNDDPDPRQAFSGFYDTDDFDVLLTLGADDTLMNFTKKTELEFELRDNLDDNEMRVQLEDFIEDIMMETLGKIAPASFSIDIDDDAVAEISNNQFSIDNVDYTITVFGGTTSVFSGEFSGEGELNDGNIEMDFEFTIQVAPSNYVFTGTAVAEKK